MEKIEVKDVVKILIKDPNVIREKQLFCLELGLSQSDYHQLELHYNTGVVTGSDLLLNVISKWISSQQKAKFSTFLDVLKNCSFVCVEGNNEMTNK